MTATTHAHNSTAARRLASALAENRLDEADELLADWAGELPRDVALIAADLHVRRLRFTQARAILDGLSDLDIHGRLKRNSARNYASLQQHRPDIYRRLIATKISSRYQLAPVAGNRLTLADCRTPQKPVILSPGGDPVAAVHRTLSQLEARMREGAAVGLIGIGDGFVLGSLARISPKLYMDMQICVHLFEPDLSLLHMCFLLHDYSGPDGPIEQRRVQWYAGEDWQKQYEGVMERDLMLPRAGVIVQQSTDRESITPAVQKISKVMDERQVKLREAAHHHYAGLDAEELATRFEAQPFEGQIKDRKPRVLLMTSRFTTVLQYATKGVAAGFESLGWQSLTLIEPTPYHQISKLTLSEAVARFQPDLVFQIDHLRHEHENIFAPQLPFACWIQDHLAHLTKIEAGKQVKQRDFVLSFATPLFIDTYKYPARQCIDMPMMLTSPRSQNPARQDDVPDLVYVSNVSQQPSELIEKVVRCTAEQWKPLARNASRELIARYEQGQSLPSHHDVRLLLDEVIAGHGHAQPDDGALRRLIEDLWNPLNSALYRQQALRWVVAAAREMKLSVGLYGLGWETNPEFAALAKGVIQNGEPLAALTRSAKINLNLEPYVCFTHQRLLDGLVAGGFYLVRHHPGNSLLQELLNFMEAQGDDESQSSSEAIAACEPARQSELERLIKRAACLTFAQNADPVRQVRCWQRAGVLIHQEVALPHLSDVSFNDAASCKAMIERFVRADQLRQSISDTQRKSIESRLSFDTGVRMVISRIASLLRQESREQLAHDDLASDGPMDGAQLRASLKIKPEAA